MKPKTFFRRKESGRKINNLRLIHIAELVDAGVDPKDFNFIEELTNRYIFEHIQSGKLVSIRR